MKKIAVIGAGNLGISIIEGLLKNNAFEAKQIIATRNNLAQLEHLGKQGVTLTNDNHAAVSEADYVLLCVKPYKVEEVLTQLKNDFNTDKLVISVATGISLETYQKLLPENMSIFRAMPNTAASVEESITCICGNTSSQTLVNEVKTIFNPIGETVVINEELMNAATVVGACGIAYVLRFIRAMIQGGIEIGFDAQTASKIVTQTVKGAAELLIVNGLHPEQEIDKVTTPKGCTIAGLNEMEHQGFSSALIKGIKTSFEKI
ncbi:pyrroline-5-carboxylate reductase [Empedobacter brevis]|uniref:pyrroline-5-carboxylate reductase n=1 Tax=Empedobacter brevis TaxID=247 RepID=UPI0039AFB985